MERGVRLSRTTTERKLTRAITVPLFDLVRNDPDLLESERPIVGGVYLQEDKRSALKVTKIQVERNAHVEVPLRRSRHRS